MKHKSIKIVGISLMSAMLLMGCGSSNTSTDTQTSTEATATPAAESETSSTENADTATYGEITEITDSTITIALGTMNARGNGNKEDQAMATGAPEDGTMASGAPEDGTMPSGAPEDGTMPSGAPEDGTMPSGAPEDGTMPSGAPEDGTMPSGAPDASSDTTQKGGNGGGRSMLELTGETLTLTITDSTAITIKSMDSSSEGTLSDLAVGDTISYETADDNTTATSITVSQMKGMGGGQNKGDVTATEAPQN